MKKDCRASLAMTLLMLFVSLLLPACGKKGPPTLKAYEKPAAPSDLRAVHREDKILLSWSYPENLRVSLKGFEVLRSTDDVFKKIAFVDKGESLFADDIFKIDSAYRYKIIARSLKDILSGDSNIVTASPKTLPSPPENFRLTITSGAIDLSWSSSGEGVCYNIYKTTEKGKYPETPLNREPVCTTLYRDYVLLPDRNGYYLVRPFLNTSIRDEGYAAPELEVGPSQYIPSPPSDLRTVRSDDKVYLMWKESPESWVRGYRIYRKDEGEKDFRSIGETKIPSFVDMVGAGKKVWYSVRALGPSAESEPVTVEVP